MRELHVVATSEDGRHVVLATTRGASKGDFRVAIDDRLSAAVRGDLPRPGETEPVVVTPKEIQARLRAGETQEQIAASAGVPLTKIERYAGPVLSEIERVLNQARAGFVSRSRLGESALPLGEAVDRHLADTVGVRLETVEWSARREEVGTWLVELTYVSQARRRTATWRYDVAHREVTPTDANSAALAHVEPGHRRSRTAADTDLVAASPARRPAPRAAAPVRTRPAAKAKKAPKAPKAPKVTTVRAAPAPVRSVSARPPVRAAAPVPHAVAPARAAQAAVDKAALAREARAEAARVAAQEKAAKAAAAEAARQAAAEAAAAEQARKAEADKAAAEKKAAQKKAAAAKAAAEKRAAEKKAAAAKAAAEKRAAEKKAAAEKARKAKAAAEKRAAEKAAAEKAAAEKAAAEKAAAEKAAAEAARVAAEVPPGPPTLRVVGAEDAPVRRGPKEPPAAARTAPARAAGQRASVPGWADVLLSTAPVARSADPEPDPDEG